MKKIRIPINNILFSVTFIIAIIPACFTYIPIIQNKITLNKIKSNTLKLSEAIVEIIQNEYNKPEEILSPLLKLTLKNNMDYSKDVQNKHRYNIYILTKDGNIIEKDENILKRNFSLANEISKNIFLDDYYLGSDFYCGKKILQGSEIENAKKGIKDFKIRNEVDITGQFNLINTTTYTAVPCYFSDSFMSIVLIIYDVEKPLFHFNNIWDYFPSIFSIIFAIVLGIIFYFTINKKLVLIAKKTSFYAQQEGHVSQAKIKLSKTCTEITNVSEQFENLVNKINNNMDFLETFSSDVSHELKNPIASIKLNSEYLLNSDMDFNKNALTPIQEEINHIENLLQEMSNNIILNNQTKEIVNFNYRDSLYKILAKEKEKYPDKNFSYITDSNCKYNLIIREEHFERIFENLIDNAASFAAVIQINEKVIDNENMYYMLLSVEDSGPGINNSEIKMIFNRFYSNRTPIQDKNIHSGIGLSTVKTLVDLYNGKIEVSKSSLLGGASFNIFLKIKKN